jgi:hypothetical protein
MRKLCLLLLLSATLAMLTAGCTTTPRGDREFIPGRGLEPVD